MSEFTEDGVTYKLVDNILHRAVGATDKNCCECGQPLEGKMFTTVGATFYDQYSGFVTCKDGRQNNGETKSSGAPAKS